MAKFELFVSHDCGISYHKEDESERIDKLLPKMKEFDKKMLRWYLEKNGELCQMSMIHIEALYSMKLIYKYERRRNER